MWNTLTVPMSRLTATSTLSSAESAIADPRVSPGAVTAQSVSTVVVVVPLVPPPPVVSVGPPHPIAAAADTKPIHVDPEIQRDLSLNIRSSRVRGESRRGPRLHAETGAAVRTRPSG